MERMRGGRSESEGRVWRVRKVGWARVEEAAGLELT